jgi:hypothetical protein
MNRREDIVDAWDSGVARGVSHDGFVEAGKRFCARPLVRSINSGDRRVGFEAPALSGSCGAVAGSAVYSRCPRALARGVEYQAAMRRQPHTMLWVRPCKSAIDLTLQIPRM